MEYRFETNWNALQDLRISLVKSVTNTKNSHARRAVAMDKLRTLTMHAGIFAVTSVHNSVKNNEEQYYRWTQGGAITGLGIHVAGPENVGRFVSTMNIHMFEDLSGRSFVDNAFGIFGLGSAKATFMGALLGFDNCCCIDTHMFKMAKEKGVTNLAGVPGSLNTYRKLSDAIGWTHTLDQWRAFMVVPYYAKHQHDVYFNGILGRNAVTATV